MAHNNYYLDLTVDTFIVNGDAVLLRFHDKYQFWNVPGGHLDPGEDLNQAALREVWEEAGLEVELVGPQNWSKTDTQTTNDLVPPVFLNRLRINEHHDHSSSIFFARSTSRDVNPQAEEDKGAQFKWVTQSELDDMLEHDTHMRLEVHRYASAALQQLSS